MEDAPAIWPPGSRLAGSPMLTSEKEAWLRGYIAALDEAAVVLRPATPPDLASHSDVDVSEEVA